MRAIRKLDLISDLLVQNQFHYLRASAKAWARGRRLLSAFSEVEQTYRDCAGFDCKLDSA